MVKIKGLHTQESVFERIQRHIDWILVGAVLALIIIGLVMVYSATIRFGNPGVYVSKQFFGIVIGITALLIIIGLDYGILKSYYYHIYAVSIILLVLVLLIGTKIRGTRAWIDLGYFSFQPSELSKLLFIISLAGYLDKYWQKMNNWRKLCIPLIMLIGNVGLILIQPDFSGSLVYFPVFLVMLYVANTRLLHLLGIVFYALVTLSIPLLKTLFGWKVILENHLHTGLGIVCFGLLLIFIRWFLKRWRIFVPAFYFISIFAIFISGVASSYVVNHSLKEYQKKRLVAFINPRIDPLNTGYNIIQSEIAIGSGRIFGKGLFSGTQSQLGFIPARHTDFIFSLIAEEMGFIFSLAVIGLYILLLWRIINVVKVSSDKYGALIAVGVLAMFSFYVIINIGMTLRLMPVTGLPLPFLSYGGSSIVSSIMAIGILLSIYVRRYVY
ncbi:MAG: rod shape-determining protein RodA [Elusimicrobia bacterium CG1_02_37_114]|nr:MAG: rod shape-determining protein RodA [Elusimicrobia bacterium CG1_02_37_114]PIZ12657.1 MAG: rod shape-determining protein RodA [Elusimicrobia bacterium CG_4_10_14_0_8_um_filter_37_32]